MPNARPIPEFLKRSESESILQEAQRLVHGARQHDYGHPADDFERIAGMLNALFASRLRVPFRAEDIPLIMVCVKLSREINSAKRDNLVDLAGYAETRSMVLTRNEAQLRKVIREVLTADSDPSAAKQAASGVQPRVAVGARRQHLRTGPAKPNRRSAGKRPR